MGHTANRVYLETENGDTVYFQCKDYDCVQVLIAAVNNLTDATARQQRDK